MGNFIWGANGAEVTPEEIATRKQIAQSLLAQSQQPANYWTQGMANMANALMGGFMQGRAMRAERANDDYNEALTAGLNGDGMFGGAGTSANNPQVNSSLGSDAAMRAQGEGDQSDPFGGSGTDVNHPLVQPLLPQGGVPARAASINPVAAALTNPQTGVTSPIAQNGASDLLAQGVIEHIRQAESAGDNAAKNPRSSATGAFQFTNPTWTGLMRQHPELGLTADGRTDPAQSEAAAKQLASDNIAYMLAKGVQNPTQGQAYLAHFAGAPAATNLIQADPSAPASSILSPAQVAANPFLRGMTAGQVQDWAAQKMGSRAPQAQQTPAPQPSAGYGAPAPVQSGPSMSALIGVLSDPRANQQTRGVASALLNNQLQLQQVQQRYAMEQADPENVARRRYYDMETARIAHQMAQPAKQGPEWRDLTPQEVAQSGRPPGQGWQVSQTTGEVRATAKTPLVNVSTTQKADDALNVELAKGRADTINTAAGNYQNDSALAKSIETLKSINPQLGSGGALNNVSNAFSPYAQVLGIKNTNQPARDLWNSLIQEQVRASHIPGEGSDSNQDAARVEKMFPSLSQTPEGRTAILNYMEAKQARKMAFDSAAWQRQNNLIDDTEYQNKIGQLFRSHIDISPIISLAENGRAPHPGQATPSVSSMIDAAKPIAPGVTYRKGG